LAELATNVVVRLPKIRSAGQVSTRVLIAQFTTCSPSPRPGTCASSPCTPLAGPAIPSLLGHAGGQKDGPQQLKLLFIRTSELQLELGVLEALLQVAGVLLHLHRDALLCPFTVFVSSCPPLRVVPNRRLPLTSSWCLLAASCSSSIARTWALHNHKMQTFRKYKHNKFMKQIQKTHPLFHLTALVWICFAMKCDSSVASANQRTNQTQKIQRKI
jgi:hypothetical protein